MEDFDRQINQLGFPKGLINAPGILGFAPEKKKREWWAVLDAFVTNPISYRPRKASARLQDFKFREDGKLFTSFINAGFKSILRNFKDQWAKAEIPIIVSLIEEEKVRLKRMIRELEEIENILAIKLIIADDFSAQLINDLFTTTLGELPIICHLSVDRALSLADQIMRVGASAISLGPSRESVRNSEGFLTEGWKYGPANFPHALAICKDLAKAGIQVIAGGGIYEVDQARAMLDTGALAVQLDTVMWKADWDASQWLLRED